MHSVLVVKLLATLKLLLTPVVLANYGGGVPVGKHQLYVLH